MNVKDIIDKNNERIERLSIRYNPYNGEGSPIERVKLHLTSVSYILIPLEMAKDPIIVKIMGHGSLEGLVKGDINLLAALENSILLLRAKYDFEYWGVVGVKIQDKQSKRIVPFVMRAAQLKLFKELYTQMVNEQPIRVILLKARQWGGSTLVQIFMAWIQLFHRKLWHSVIVGDVEEQARNIRAMYSRLAQYHPKELQEIKFQGFEGSTKNKKIVGRDAVIYLGSMQRPDSLRSADVMMAHISEIGLWRTTEGKSPEDVVQSIAGTIPAEPYSLIVMESTAKGVGNYFHRQWQAATAGTIGYIPLFVAWFEIEIYSKEFASEQEMFDFALTLTDDEIEYFRLGATLQAINWYRFKMHTDGYDKWRMCCEFPTTPVEAFQSTGKRAHAPHYVSSLRKYCKEPLYRGDMYPLATHGKEAISRDLYFQGANSGPMWVWALPEREPEVLRRYIVSMDIGGRAAGADWSVVSVIDRYWLLEGGVEEAIATCRFHLDQDLAVWKAVQIAKYYNNALLVIEANSLNSKGTEGDHTLTILDEIKEIYPHLYCRSDPQRIKEGMAERFGFFTSRASKTDLVNQMNRRFREQGYIERDARALDEADCYELHDDGSYGAVEGTHDDIYMSRAIALKASQTTALPFCR